MNLVREESGAYGLYKVLGVCRGKRPLAAIYRRAIVKASSVGVTASTRNALGCKATNTTPVALRVVSRTVSSADLGHLMRHRHVIRRGCRVFIPVFGCVQLG